MTQCMNTHMHSSPVPSTPRVGAHLERHASVRRRRRLLAGIAWDLVKMVLVLQSLAGSLHPAGKPMEAAPASVPVAIVASLAPPVPCLSSSVPALTAATPNPVP